jgi:transcriptional regulator with XRE-family HTH domain
MDAAKREALHAAGWSVGDAADFLQMSDEERQLLDARVELALAIRRQRQASRLSQKQLAAKLNTSQPRVAKIERAATDVSLDQLVRAFTAAGGTIVVRDRKGKPISGKSSKRLPKGAVAEIARTVEIEIIRKPRGGAQ